MATCSIRLQIQQQDQRPPKKHGSLNLGLPGVNFEVNDCAAIQKAVAKFLTFNHVSLSEACRERSAVDQSRPGRSASDCPASARQPRELNGAG